MRNNVLNVILFLAAAIGLTFLYYYADKHWIPKPPKKEPPPEPTPIVTEAERKAALQAVAGILATSGDDVKYLAAVEAARQAAERAVLDKQAAARAVAGTAATIVDPRPAPVRLVALGDSTFYNRVLLTTRGGGIQQVVLPKFEAADRLGRPVKGVPMYLIPGVKIPREKELNEPYLVPELTPGVVADPRILADPAYGTFHYRDPDDKNPDSRLGEVNWNIVAEEHPEGGTHKVIFETELPAPYFLKLRKTYTLAPKDYHVGLRLEIERLPGGKKGEGKTRLQLDGPRGLPIEGEWYTTLSRIAMIGWNDRKNAPRRQYEDAATIAARRGGEVVTRGDNTLKYWGVVTQFFASCAAVDDTADDTPERGMRNPVAYVRATTEVPFDKKASQDLPQFDDVTVRAATDTIDLEPGKSIVQSYLIYNGPSKVALLGFMEGDRAVDGALVARYEDKLGLRTITDFRSESWLGRFANAIYWTDLVITFTNLMHWLLASIHGIIPSWAMSIILLTIMVRLLLLIPSKKQTQMNLKMMEVQKKLAPQIEELKKKFGDDPSRFNQEKMRLMMANGVNPLAAMGGCLLLIFQLPVMMGLFFCLQESIFFRLEPFLWVQNLAAPDMLLWWSEGIPYISTPDNLGSFLYLGPYLNLLPILAVSLMIWQQNKLMPPATDPQAEQQRMMMKVMMVMMAFFFYKYASGLALYFIISTTWGLIERQFTPKASDKPADGGGGTGEPAGLPPRGGSPNGQPTEPARPKGFFGKLKQAMKDKMEEIQKQADEMAKRQIRNPNENPNQPRREPDRRDRDRDKKKKRRK